MERVMFILYTTYIVKSEANGPDESSVSTFFKFKASKYSHQTYYLQAARVKDVHPDWNDEDIFQVPCLLLLFIIIFPTFCPPGQAVPSSLNS